MTGPPRPASRGTRARAWPIVLALAIVLAAAIAGGVLRRAVLTTLGQSILPGSPSASPDPAGALPAWPEGAEGEKVAVHVVGPRRRHHIDSAFWRHEPAPGNVFWCCGLVVANMGSTVHHANPNNVSLVMTDGQTFSYSATTHALEGHDFPAVDVQPGKNASGLIVFEIPADSKPERLVYSPMFGHVVQVGF